MEKEEKHGCESIGVGEKQTGKFFSKNWSFGKSLHEVLLNEKAKRSPGGDRSHTVTSSHEERIRQST